MDIFDVLTLIGGLCLFLFGMNVMGDALERRAGSSLKTLLSKLTQNKIAGFLTGLAVTAVIQSSSATTVMVVGFVNSGLMTLKQSIGVIMGANIGTTVTAWILSLSGISGDSLVVQMLKPMSFTPILALIGTAMLMFSKSSKKKDTATILLGFAVLMFGMDIMSGAVSGLKDIPAFRDLFLMFRNPILGVIVGAVVTGIIQSSSASVGMLQALTVTGQVSYAAAIPIIMGQNIGTCVTALLSSFGTNKNAKRAAIVHLFFNIIGTAVCLTLFTIVSKVFAPPLLDQAADYMGIAVCHSAFNIFCTAFLLPASAILEKIAYLLVPEAKQPDTFTELDERLLSTPAIALEQCSNLVVEMAEEATSAFEKSLDALNQYDAEAARAVRDAEDHTDHYEDILGTYLLKLSRHQVSDSDSAEISKLLKVIGDFERIADHAVNVVESAEELKEKDISLTPEAKQELGVLTAAVREVLALSRRAFVHHDIAAAYEIEPLEQVIDGLKLRLRTSHIRRMKEGNCTIEAGFVWSDLLNSLERTADHCSNVAICLIDADQNRMDLHESLHAMKQNNPDYQARYEVYSKKYTV